MKVKTKEKTTNNTQMGGVSPDKFFLENRRIFKGKKAVLTHERMIFDKSVLEILHSGENLDKNFASYLEFINGGTKPFADDGDRGMSQTLYLFSKFELRDKPAFEQQSFRFVIPTIARGWQLAFIREKPSANAPRARERIPDYEKSFEAFARRMLSYVGLVDVYGGKNLFLTSLKNDKNAYRVFEKAAERAYGTPDVTRLIADLREKARSAVQSRGS